MKKFALLALATAFAFSCGSKDKGELIGVKGKRWHPEKPYGMSLIPGGAFVMGKSDADVLDIQDAPTKTVTVRSFYMDETEITNSEYRQFVNWVRDSIIRRQLAIKAEEELGFDVTEGDEGLEDGIGRFYPKSLIIEEDGGDEEEFSYARYSNENSLLSSDVDPIQVAPLDWNEELTFDTSEYPDEPYAVVLDDMFLPMNESFNGERTWDVRKFKFEYTAIDVDGAARAYDSIMKGLKQRSDFIKKEDVLVYPDTTVWIRDFDYAYNEPMHNDYFWHEAYGDYPVVGITWKQADAFCQWRTIYKNGYQKSKGKQNVNTFRLPSEAEWEYAARGGLEGAAFPWGGPYAKNDRGCFLANFKPLRGNYSADQALYTVEADAYEPNDYNLYNMAGNVSEWVQSSYDAASYEYSSSFNPNVNDKQNPKKVVRGGSWKDVAYFLQVSTRDYEVDTIPRSYIGFRTVQDYLGTDATANAATN